MSEALHKERCGCPERSRRGFQPSSIQDFASTVAAFTPPAANCGGTDLRIDAENEGVSLRMSHPVCKVERETRNQQA